MIKVIGINFLDANRIYYFSPNNIKLKKGDYVIVETERGMQFGQAVTNIEQMPKEKVFLPLKDVIRKANKDDINANDKNARDGAKALNYAKELVNKQGLDMKLFEASYTFDRKKLIFKFIADERVDFRELAKLLAAKYKTRIELRQIGVRDEAKTIGGLGPCGRKLCCSSWLGDFQPVSIKMAKDQSLSLNPTKISGICGRLFCCLKYEHDVYAEAIDAMPVVGALVKVDEAKGKVIEVNPLLEQVRIEFNDKTIKVCHKDEVKVLHEPKKCGGCGSLRDEGLDEATLRELKKLED